MRGPHPPLAGSSTRPRATVINSHRRGSPLFSALPCRLFCADQPSFCPSSTSLPFLFLPGVQVICPDKWKEGATNTIESGGRKLNENKLLTKKKRCAFLFFFFRPFSLNGFASGENDVWPAVAADAPPPSPSNPRPATSRTARRAARGATSARRASRRATRPTACTATPALTR